MTTRRAPDRRTRLLTRAVPVALIAAAAFAGGIYLATASSRDERQIVRRYVAAWVRHDFSAMYRMLDPASQRRLTEAAFAADYAAAATTATLTSLQIVAVGDAGASSVSVRMRAHTRVFGTLTEPLRVPFATASGRVRFAGTLLFPGLQPGEQLTRTSVLGARGALLADDGTPLAEGPGRSSPIPTVAGEIVGTLGPIPAADRARFAALGYPSDAKVGQDGLELIFQRRLGGQPGGTLLAGRRALASVKPRPGSTVRTTIDPAIEQAAITALGGSYAGMTVLDPRNGAVLALAGIAFDLQPPGSTFKIITVTGVLEAGLATPSTVYPVQTSANIDGYILHNAASEACGGTLLNAFAVSCDSVFAPLGLQLGAKRLVATAEAFGFNDPTGIAGALESTIPSAATIGDGVAIGSSAIGQGQVLASTLEMADAAAAIADGGRRPLPTLRYHARPRFVHVTSPQIAGEVQQMMQAVVQYGTGTAAQISGVEVAGKTGTAELANTGNEVNNKAETDGWFVGYAPVGAARVVACALFPSAGYGATSAAPAVQQALVAALATSQ